MTGAAVLLAASALALSPEQVVSAYQRAERTGDRATLDRLLAPEFVQHHATGAVEERASYLANRGGPQPLTAGRSYLERGVEWRLMGNVAQRTSISRIRGAKPGVDLWVRGTVLLLRNRGRWQVADLTSALIYEGSRYDADQASSIGAGEFATPDRQRVSLMMVDRQPWLVMGGGPRYPLIAIAPDCYAIGGGGAVLRLSRDVSGGIAAISRWQGDRAVWVANRSIR